MADKDEGCPVVGVGGVGARFLAPQSDAGSFGYAFDGFPIYGSTEPDGSQPETWMPAMGT
ncbi:MAG: hypothetical protein AAFS04_00770 [Cyanobacteria bacterium J06631_9]